MAVITERLGLNFHVFSTLLFRGWTICAGGLTLLLLPVLLSATEQGYYYTFSSVLALQIFFELGLNQVVMQFVSHEVAHLAWTHDGQFTGPSPNLDRLSSLVRLIRKWYLFAATFFVVAAGATGVFFFRAKGSLPPGEWIGAWLVTVSSTAVNLFWSPSLAILEGSGKVGQIAGLRMKQSIVGYLALWSGMAGHLGLWAAAALPTASALCTGLWLHQHGAVINWLRSRVPATSERVSWSGEILPLQWRIAVSWVAGYFIFNLFTPIIFSKWGAVEAGKMGIALAMFSAISTVGMSWVNATSPQLMMCISRGERQELNAKFKAVLYRSVAVTVGLCVAFLLTVRLLSVIGFPLAHRLASIGELSCLAIVTAANSVVFSLAAYMRAHKEEPMLPVSVTCAALTAISLYLGAQFSIQGMMFGYAAVTLLVALPWTFSLFMKYFRRR